MNILDISVQNPDSNPWLTWIYNGVKKYEGRLQNKIKDWDLYIGKLVRFYDPKRPSYWVIVRITSLKLFDTFGAAFHELGQELVPGNWTCGQVVDLYNIFYPYDKKYKGPGRTSDYIREHGVVAIGFDIVEKSQ